jgi:hypothetical protein
VEAFSSWKVRGADEPESRILAAFARAFPTKRAAPGPAHEPSLITVQAGSFPGLQMGGRRMANSYAVFCVQGESKNLALHIFFNSFL